MADYIYLLQNRLNAAQRTAVEAVRNAARNQSMPVFLVGGAVRDLTSGAPVRDLDFAVQGEVAPLLGELEAAGAMVAGENPVLRSTFLLFGGGVRVELGPTVTITYPKPGQPEVQPAAILDDLRRRDFTANAMAISLNEGSFGLLLDPLNGAADTENRELRLSSNYGFIEQPAVLLRAARLTDRLGWTLEERTRARYETAKEEGYISALGEWDRGYEVEEIFHEEDPLAALEHLRSEGWGDTLPAALEAGIADASAMDRARDLMGQLEQIGIPTDASPVLFPLVTAKLSKEDANALKAAFARQGFREQIESLGDRGKELASQLTGAGAARPSDTWKLLHAAEPEVVLWAMLHARTPAVQSKLKSFVSEWPQMRQRIPYALMQEMRVTPDLPGYDQLLEDLFFALLDGKLSTPEATREFLEPFSPPAPVVQAAPRRKAAKGTRGRSRKSQPVEPEEEEISSEAAEAETSDVSEPDEPEVPEREASPIAEPKASVPASASQGRSVPAKKEASSASEVSAAPAKVPASASSASVKKSAAKSSPPVEAKAIAKPVQAAAPAPSAKAPSAKPVAQGKKAVTPAPAVAKKESTPLKAVEKSVTTSTKQVPVKATPAKVPNKAAKKAPAPASKATPASAKGSAGAVKGQPAKAVARKAAAKQVQPARPVAKKTPPAKKAPAKARRR